MLAPWWQRLPSRLLDEDRALSSLREGEDRSSDRTNGSASRTVNRGQGGPIDRTGLVRRGGPIPASLPGRLSLRAPDTIRQTDQFPPVQGYGRVLSRARPDNWHPHYTAADMILSAWRLIVKEIISTFEPIEIPSRHVSDLAEQVRLGGGVLVRSPGLEERLRGAEGNAEFDLVWPTRNLSSVFPVSFPKGEPLPDALRRSPANLITRASSFVSPMTLPNARPPHWPISMSSSISTARRRSAKRAP